MKIKLPTDYKQVGWILEILNDGVLYTKNFTDDGWTCPQTNMFVEEIKDNIREQMLKDEKFNRLLKILELKIVKDTDEYATFSKKENLNVDLL